jgi:hypothetical protein
MGAAGTLGFSGFAGAVGTLGFGGDGGGVGRLSASPGVNGLAILEATRVAKVEGGAVPTKFTIVEFI